MRWFVALSGLMVVAAAHAEGEAYKALRSPSAEATSYLQTNWNRFTENYHPTYVLDEDPATAWVEGADGLGEGQTLALPLSHIAQARSVRVRIRNGYQKSRGLLASNAAPERVRLTLTDGTTGTTAGTVEATLTKTMGWQDVIIPVESGGFDTVSLEVLSAHTGTRYNDTCISDILVEVDSDVPYSAQAEAARLHEARTWIGERVQAAQYFANLPETYPFHAEGYRQRRVDQPLDEALIAQRLDGEGARLDAAKALDGWYDVSLVRRIEPAEGLYEFDHVLQLFVPENVAWFEAEGPRDTTVEERIPEEDWVSGSVTTSRDKVRFADDSRSKPREVYRRVQTIEHGRGIYTEDLDYLVRYNDAGRVASLYARTSGGMEGIELSGDHLIQLTYDGDGKLVQWEKLERDNYPTVNDEGFQFTATRYQRWVGTVHRE